MNSDQIEIVTKIGDTDLRDLDGRPNADVGSDHFPIRFGITEPRKE